MARDPFAQPERYKGDPRSPLYPSLIERLCLAIIDAYPSPDGRGKRLQRALRALTGKPARKGPKNGSDLEKLIELAQRVSMPEAMRDFEQMMGWPTAGAKVSRREAAAAVAGKRLSRQAYDPAHAENDNARRLRREYARHAEYLSIVANKYDLPEEQDQLNALNQIAKVLAPFNLELRIEPLELGMGTIQQGQSRGAT